MKSEEQIRSEERRESLRHLRITIEEMEGPTVERIIETIRGYESTLDEELDQWPTPRRAYWSGTTRVRIF